LTHGIKILSRINSFPDSLRSYGTKLTGQALYKRREIRMTKPEISISTYFDYKVPLTDQIPLIAEAGFTHISLGQDEEHSGILEKHGREKLQSLLQQHHLKIDTIHGISLCYPYSAERMKPIIKASAELGVPVVIAHPIPFDIGQADFADLLSKIKISLKELELVLKETGIKLALENVLPGPSTDLAIEAGKRSESEYIGFCYDSSHDQVDGPRPFDLLDFMKDRLLAVHLSDRVREFVDHVPPGEGFIDWEALTSSLKKTIFKGPLLFEVMVEHSSVKEPEQFLRLVYEKACYVNSLMKTES
jgi:sugar phosphate isomerase/epimerase